MRSVLKRTTMLASIWLSMGIVAGAPVMADDPGNKGNATAAVSAARDGFVIGDRLKITVFEIIGNQTEAAANSFVERQEMTGEYTIQQNGSLSISFIGLLPVIGKTQSQIEGILEGEYLRLLGIKSKVTMRLLEREPVYVTGPGMKPGYIKYTPGMIALQAIALVDGLDRSSDWMRVDIARERERMTKSQEKAKTLQARLRVLQTERDEKAPAADQDHNEIDAVILARESRLRDAEQQKHLAQVSMLTTIIQMTEMELGILRERLTSAEESVKQKEEWFKTVEKPYSKGLATAVTYNQVKTDLNTARERWLEVKTAMAQTERKLFESEQEKKRVIAENDIRRQNEMKDLTTALTDDTLTQRSIGSILRNFGDMQLRVSEGTHNQIVVTILRQSATGRLQIEADMFTVLHPGDILQLKPVDLTTDTSSKKSG